MTVIGVHISVAQQRVILTSTLNAKLIAHPQEMVVFTCIARGSGILNWFSTEYVGSDGLPLQILSGGNTVTVPSNSNPTTVATRINVTTNGEIMIISELQVIASLQYPIATVTCSNGVIPQNITFQTVGEYMIYIRPHPY